MKKGTIILVSLIILALGLIIGYFFGFEKGKDEARTYQATRSIDEIKNELLSREVLVITSFLEAKASIETKDEGSLFTTKYVNYLTGTLTNNAAIAIAKDIKIKVIYLSKTGSEIGTQEITIYEFVKPGHTIHFRNNISVPEQMTEVKFHIVEANANN